MKAKQNNKLKMYNALTTVMESNKKIWSRVKEIEKSYKSFLDGNNKLNILKEDHEKSLQPLIDKKSLVRKNLILETLPIANVIVAFAIEKNYKKLVNACNFSKAELKESKDLELVEHSKTIWKEAKKLYNKSIATSDTVKSKEKEKAINIHNYGLTGQMIDKLEIANVAFIESHLELKDAIVHKNKCSKKISSILKSNKKLLKNKLDLLMSLFKTSDSIFYKKYTEARIIHKAIKTKEVKTENKKTVSNLGEIKKVETAPANNEGVAIKVVPKRKPRSRTPIVKKVVAEPIVTKTEILESSVKKPVVKKTVVSRPSVSKSTVTKTVRRKPVSRSKTPVVKKVADEPAKEL